MFENSHYERRPDKDEYKMIVLNKFYEIQERIEDIKTLIEFRGECKPRYLSEAINLLNDLINFCENIPSVNFKSDLSPEEIDQPF